MLLMRPNLVLLAGAPVAAWLWPCVRGKNMWRDGLKNVLLFGAGIAPAIAAVAVMTKQEMLLAIVGGLFVVESLSVIVQVVSYKTRGKRVFRMAPLHHHFELSGWPESRVVIRFWILAILFAVLGLSTLKLR